MAGKEGLAYSAAEFSKKVDLVTIAGGVLLASGPIVFYGMLGYIAGDIVSEKLEKKNG